ncbi:MULTISPECIES: bifunctional cytochrome P450/NADPH--P450 reductase [Streptomyces]|uniref:bifunctional cytochrome P450/NADPH--P450 reductase n=1 Tax=Streptomyces TaxID=1883 RepID=UPI001E4BB667|nr:MULTISPECIES: cytochrome P450 [Streptomyces]UFQ19595.1 cytochrome P450 [Streptomyces huasconensis]WCL89213.1 cytochrome P450 [Streptomyces sp. JCM 35825]
MSESPTVEVHGPRNAPDPAYPAPPTVDITATGLSSTPVQQAVELARRYGPLYVRRYHGRDSLWASSLELVEELSDETRFAKGVGPALENVRGIAGDGLFTAYDDEPNWAKAHDILLPAFAMNSMRTYHPHMLRVARRLIASWDGRFAPGAARSAPVEVSEDMTRMTLDTIGLSGFGYDFDSFARTDPHPFVEALVRSLGHSQAKLARTPGGDYAAEDAEFAADAAFLAEVVDEVIESRKAAGDTATDDLLGLMLNSPHPGSGEVLDEANIRNQVITFLIAGHETTSGTLSFALYHLLKNPAALHRAQAEVDALWGDTPDPEPSYEDVGRLRYVRQVLNETLRLWPTAPAFQRRALADTVLGGRHPMKAGEFAVVLTPMLHRDPVWGDNVEEFDPERFAPEAEAARSPHAYKPFGTGERACIGRQFALHEATMLLGMLIHRYRFIDHCGYELKVKETLTLKPDGFTMALAARTPEDRARSRSALRELVSLTGTDGSAGAADRPADGLPARVTAGTALTVLHGSNFGTCRAYAEQLGEHAADLGFDVRVAPLDEAVGALPTDTPVVIVAASYNGQPTDDAHAFVSWLTDAAPDAAVGVRYAVLGVGDRNWAATYQRVPTLIDDALAASGATRLLKRAEADASGDLTGAVRHFATELRDTLLRRYGDPESVGAADAAATAPACAYDVVEVTGGPLDALAARHGTAAMTVVESTDLVDGTHPLARPKRFLRVALPDGVTYRTGDHLTVLPANRPEAVERAAAVLGVDLDAVLNVRAHRPSRATLPLDRPIPVRELLARYVELGDAPTQAQVALLAEHNPCPPERISLEQLAADPMALAARQGGLLDLIEDHPALRGMLPWPVLLELLPPIRTRHYSISSSPAMSPGHADLMVSLLSAPDRSGRGTFRGTGSSYLYGLRPGDTLHARVQPCRDAFRLPGDGRTPVIMVGAGTGLAPFRGAIADRLHRLRGGAQLPPALCYFGCDHPDADYLHRAELEEAERAGAVSMRPAFSKTPEGDLRYVQHRIAAEAEEVWRLLEAGATVRVCGDGSRMAPGVRQAFQRIRTKCEGGDAAAAEAWWQGLVAAGRYVEDVYASTPVTSAR